MTNIGLIGAVETNKTQILRMFVWYLKQGLIENTTNDITYSIEKTDFSGDAVIDPEESNDHRETKTIHPNRVVFKEGTNGINHTIYDPGGDIERAVVKMSLNTICRIAKQIVVVFAADQSLHNQFDFYEDVRAFPKEISVCFNNINMIQASDKQKYLQVLEEKVREFFAERNIHVKHISYASPDGGEEYTVDNDATVKLLFNLATETDVTIKPHFKPVPEHRSDPKPEITSESKPDLKPKPKPEPKPEPKSELIPELKPDIMPGPKPGPKPEPKLVTKPEIKKRFAAYQGSKPFIFVSYCHKDIEWVYPIITELHNKGYRIWYDEGIPASAEYRKVITHHVAICHTFLVFLTPNVIESEWVKDEMDQTRERWNKEKQTVIPIYLVKFDVPEDIKSMIRRIQAIMKYDLDDSEFIKVLCASLKPELLD